MTGIRIKTCGVVPMGSNPSNASSIRLIVNLYQLSKAAGGTTARMNVQKLTKTLHSPCRQKMGGFPGNSEVRGNCVAGYCAGSQAAQMDMWRNKTHSKPICNGLEQIELETDGGENPS